MDNIYHDTKLQFKSRFFIDERIGCIAVRDSKHPEYNESYPGLHFDTVDVVFYAHGQLGEKGWYIDQRAKRKAEAVLKHLQVIEDSMHTQN